MDDCQSLHPAIRGLRTVCRCNNIKYRTLERTIREGAHTIAEVARRTGATTGYCGGTCTPDILAMITEIAGTPTPCIATPVPAGSIAEPWWVRKK